MGVPSKRFESLTQQTNIGTADFLDVNTASIFNSPNNSFTGIPADLEKFISDFYQKGEGDAPVKEAGSSLGFERAVNTLSGGFRDLSTLNTRDIDNAIAGVIPNPTLQSAFRQISAKCKNKALTPLGFGKPFDMSMGCGDGNSNNSGGGCDSAQFSDVLSKMTGGEYNRTYKDINNMMNNMLALSNYGFDMNMCGAFGALLTAAPFSTLPSNSVSRLSSVLLASVNSSGNVLGALDIASVSATRDLTPILENPNGIMNMFSNYKTPVKVKDTGLSSMTDRVFGAATIFGSSSWNKSKHDDKLSTVNLGNYNKQFDKTLTAKVMNNIGDEDDLDSIFNDENTLMKVAYRKAA